MYLKGENFVRKPGSHLVFGMEEKHFCILKCTLLEKSQGNEHEGATHSYTAVEFYFTRYLKY